MSVSVSDRMTRVKPSATGAVLARAKALQAAGEDIISLGAGEPDFDTPLAVRKAAVAAIEAGQTRYTAIDGTPDLKSAIRAKFLRENGLDFNTSDIVVSSGAKQCIFNAALAMLGSGDEALIPAPYWVSYPDIVRLADATPVIIETGIDEGFKITPEQLERHLSDNTRALILNSPSNPCGIAYTAEEQRALGKVLERFPSVVVISDEIYEHIHWNSSPFVSFAAACPALADRTVTVNGVSKAYAMTGWRIGYAAGPSQIVSAMKTVQSQSTSNACSISQAAAVEALNGDQAPVAEMVTAYKERHDVVLALLNEIPGFECREGDGTFYVLPRVKGAIDALGLGSDIEFAELLIEKAGVATVPGTPFGAPGYLRLSFASSMGELKEALGRIKRAVAA